MSRLREIADDYLRMRSATSSSSPAGIWRSS